MSVSQAAKDHGVHETTIYDWLGKGAEGDASWTEIAQLRRENKALLELVGEITLNFLIPPKKS